MWRGIIADMEQIPKKYLWIACLPALIFAVVLGVVGAHGNAPDVTNVGGKTPPLQWDDDWDVGARSSRPDNYKLKGNIMADLADAYEVTGNGVGNALDVYGVYIKISEAVYKLDGTHFLYICSEFGESYWGISYNTDTPAQYAYAMSSADKWDSEVGVVKPPDIVTLAFNSAFYPDPDATIMVTAVSSGGGDSKPPFSEPFLRSVTFTVTGDSAFSGEYKKVRKTKNGRPVYEDANGNVMFWDGANWVVGTSLDDATPKYKGGTGNSPMDGEWVVNPDGSVTVYDGGGSGGTGSSGGSGSTYKPTGTYNGKDVYYHLYSNTYMWWNGTNWETSDAVGIPYVVPVYGGTGGTPAYSAWVNSATPSDPAPVLRGEIAYLVKPIFFTGRNKRQKRVTDETAFVPESETVWDYVPVSLEEAVNDLAARVKALEDRVTELEGA